MIKSYLLHKKKIQNCLENRRTLPDLIPLPTTHNKARPTHLLDGLCSAILALEENRRLQLRTVYNNLTSIG